MKFIEIKHKKTGKTLYSGQFSSEKECVERAAEDNASLDYADLSHYNLQCANIDTLKLSHAKLHFTNLNHANISESTLVHADCRGTSMVGTCLAESDLSFCDFSDTSFGATEIIGTRFDSSLFSTLSALFLPFHDAASLRDCIFRTIHGKEIIFSDAPISVQGLFNKPLSILGDSVLLGHKSYPLRILQTFHTLKNFQFKIENNS